MLFSNSKTSSKTRQKNYKKGTIFWTKSNIVLLGGYLITFTTCTGIILSFLLTLLTASFSDSIENSYHSTWVPGIDNASECEHSGRSWSDRKCWDDKRNPQF